MRIFHRILLKFLQPHNLIHGGSDQLGIFLNILELLDLLACCFKLFRLLLSDDSEIGKLGVE